MKQVFIVSLFAILSFSSLGHASPINPHGRLARRHTSLHRSTTSKHAALVQRRSRIERRDSALEQKQLRHAMQDLQKQIDAQQVHIDSQRKLEDHEHYLESLVGQHAGAKTAGPPASVAHDFPSTLSMAGDDGFSVQTNAVDDDDDCEDEEESKGGNGASQQKGHSSRGEGDDQHTDDTDDGDDEKSRNGSGHGSTGSLPSPQTQTHQQDAGPESTTDRPAPQFQASHASKMQKMRKPMEVAAHSEVPSYKLSDTRASPNVSNNDGASKEASQMSDHHAASSSSSSTSWSQESSHSSASHESSSSSEKSSTQAGSSDDQHDGKNSGKDVDGEGNGDTIQVDSLIPTEVQPLLFKSMTGRGTFFTPGLGACGKEDTEEHPIVAVSKDLFEQYTPNGNPNHNKLCGRKVKIEYNGKTTFARIADECPTCPHTSLDMSPCVFNVLEIPDKGVLNDMKWSIIG